MLVEVRMLKCHLNQRGFLLHDKGSCVTFYIILILSLISFFLFLFFSFFFALTHSFLRQQPEKEAPFCKEKKNPKTYSCMRVLVNFLLLTCKQGPGHLNRLIWGSNEVNLKEGATVVEYRVSDTLTLTSFHNP